MSPIEALLSRVSVPRVLEPRVTSDELDLLLRAGLRACDHGRLKPYRFVLLEGEARERLGEAMCEYLHDDLVDISEDAIEATKNKTLRAPTAFGNFGITIKPEIERYCSQRDVLRSWLSQHMLGIGRRALVMRYIRGSI